MWKAIDMINSLKFRSTAAVRSTAAEFYIKLKSAHPPPGVTPGVHTVIMNLTLVEPVSYENDAGGGTMLYLYGSIVGDNVLQIDSFESFGETRLAEFDVTRMEFKTHRIGDRIMRVYTVTDFDPTFSVAIRRA